MSQLSTPPHDTWIQPPPFASTDDRRNSARVPTALKVRLGPAREPPSTTLLCEDVSEGGLFVRCGQAVQLGARFSVELTLASGEVLYIPEAEVLYNVEGEGTRRGFGARFVSVTREAQQKLLDVARFGSDIQPRRDVSASMIMTSRERTTARMRRLAASEVTDDVVPANASAMPRVSDLRVATLRPGVGLVVPGPNSTVEPSPVLTAPSDGDELDGELHGSLIGPARSGEGHDTLLPSGGFTAVERASDISMVLSAPPLAADGDGTLPPFSAELDGQDRPAPVRRSSLGGIVMGAGGALLAGVVLAVYLGGRDAPADAATPERIPGRVSGQIAGALTAPRASADVVAPSPSPSAAPSGSGALSRLDAESAAGKGTAPKGTVVAATIPAAKPTATKAVAVPEAAKAAPRADAVKAAPRAEVPSVVAAKPAAKAEAPKQTWKEALVGTPAPAAADDSDPARLDAAMARLQAPKAAPLEIEVAAGTKVMRTHVLREPARFVVDLDTSSLPKSSLARIGRHAGFVRVVVDASGALANGTAVVSGERLVITLAPR